MFNLKKLENKAFPGAKKAKRGFAGKTKVGGSKLSVSSGTKYLLGGVGKFNKFVSGSKKRK